MIHHRLYQSFLVYELKGLRYRILSKGRSVWVQLSQLVMPPRVADLKPDRRGCPTGRQNATSLMPSGDGGWQGGDKRTGRRILKQASKRLQGKEGQRHCCAARFLHNIRAVALTHFRHSIKWIIEEEGWGWRGLRAFPFFLMWKGRNRLKTEGSVRWDSLFALFHLNVPPNITRFSSFFFFLMHETVKLVATP